MDKIAVFLRGHIRTWNYIKEENFKFFNSLPYEIDFYISTWETDETRIASLRNDFSNKNLVAFLIEPRGEYYDAFTGPAYMSTHLSKYRLEKEMSGIEYKFVIDTRFDVILKQTQPIQIPEILSFGSTELLGCYDASNPERLVPGLDDHCFLSSTTAHQIMNSRYLIEVNELGNHIGMLKFAEMHQIKCFKISWFEANLVRPNIVDNRDRVSEFYKMNNFFEEQWQRLSPTDKLNYIIKSNIDPYDYSENYHIGSIL